MAQQQLYIVSQPTLRSFSDYDADDIDEAQTVIISTFNDSLNARLLTLRRLERLALKADALYKKQGQCKSMFIFSHQEYFQRAPFPGLVDYVI